MGRGSLKSQLTLLVVAAPLPKPYLRIQYRQLSRLGSECTHAHSALMTPEITHSSEAQCNSEEAPQHANVVSAR